MEIQFSDEFAKEYRKLTDKATRLRIIARIRKLALLPESGKPLSHRLKGYRTVRIPPYRIIYRLEGDRLIINCFDHRKSVYT